jgi:hypothetical protein
LGVIVNYCKDMNNHQARRTILRLLAASSVCGMTTIASSTDAQSDCRSDHVAWVAESLKRLLTLKPGMSREQLLRVVTTEGGLVFSPLQRTFVSRDCPFFKVDIAFRRAPDFDVDGPRDEWHQEVNSDVVTSISRPYLEFTNAD